MQYGPRGGERRQRTNPGDPVDRETMRRLEANHRRLGQPAVPAVDRTRPIPKPGQAPLQRPHSF
jgi:hypothetical protein